MPCANSTKQKEGINMAEVRQAAPAVIDYFPEEVVFHGTFRKSQRRVIESINNRISEKDERKLILVAAPGSGQMEIGLEIIREIGVPALILCGTTASADAWRDTFAEKFMPEKADIKKWVSRDASVKAPIIAVTYQSLSASLNVKKPIAKWMKTAGVRMVLLEEPHHMRAEWWKGIEEVKSAVSGGVFMAIYGCLPEDSNDNEKSKIAALCGSSVSEEITTVELLREGAICPYQDYVYLCTPQGSDAEKIENWDDTTEYYLDFFRKDEGFASIIESNLGLENIRDFSPAFRENPDYFMAILSCLKSHGKPLPDPMPELLGNTVEVPELDLAGTRLLLEGYMDFDQESYAGTEEYRKALASTLQDAGLYNKGKLNFDHAEEKERVLTPGREKLEGVMDIIRTEQAALGDDLRMLILSDQIRKELSSIIGNEEKAITEIGTVTMFEKLRREMPEVRMIAHTSTFTAVPNDLLPEFEGKVKYTTKELKNTDYTQLQFQTIAMKDANNRILELLEEGKINVLLGANASAQDGMDTHAVNSLVLTAKAGNSGQMNTVRCLAMAKNPAMPNKSLNIWTLLMVDEKGQSQEKDTFLEQAAVTTGYAYDKDQIITGADRFAGMAGEMTPEQITAWNEQAKTMASDRHAIWTHWNAAVQSTGEKKKKLAEVVDFEQKVFPKTAYEKTLKTRTIVSGAIIVFILVDFFVLGLFRGLVGTWIAALLYGIVLFGMALLFRQSVQGIGSRFTPENRMMRMAQTTLEALQDLGEITDDQCEIKTEKLGESHMQFWLSGASASERKLFADTLAEAFGPVTNQICIAEERLADGSATYYPIPQIFNDEISDKNDFFRNLDTYYGGVILGYTGGKLGRELMLKSRFYGMRNPLGKTVKRMKVAK